LFTSGSSRVNNCGKRVLLEEVFPKVRSGAYTVVLVGHVNDNERTANLDRDRALNAARVLVAGADTQVRVEPGRVKADWTGTTQTASKEPGFCGTSTRTSVSEIPGATIAPTDTAAPNRRVEVWLVPTGMGMPPSATGAKDLPADIRPPR
jgi:flagellar motor protein MotB